MNQTLVDQVVNAVLYEGYILYPYRPSLKNRQRWTFGGIYPRSYSMAQEGSDRWTMQTECLVAGGEQTALAVTVRFLHLAARQVGRLVHPGAELKGPGDPDFEAVESLRLDGRVYSGWQEAEERTIDLGEVALGNLLGQPRHLCFSFPAQHCREAIRNPTGEIGGVIVRDQHALIGAVELSAQRLSGALVLVRVRILNHTELGDGDRTNRDAALLRSLVSTHTILGVRAGEFVSLLDPPEPWREDATRCHNEGTWPVLIGEVGTKDTILSSPIILYDHPQVAPESPGDLFDATEIDEILSLRILALTEEEKRTMAGMDERARVLLERTEALAGDQLWELHGTMRGPRPLATEVDHG